MQQKQSYVKFFLLLSLCILVLVVNWILNYSINVLGSSKYKFRRLLEEIILILFMAVSPPIEFSVQCLIWNILTSDLLFIKRFHVLQYFSLQILSYIYIYVYMYIYVAQNAFFLGTYLHRIYKPCEHQKQILKISPSK